MKIKTNMGTNDLQTQSKAWYDNKVLLIILFFILPPLGIYAMAKHRTDIWKKVVYIVPASLSIFLLLMIIIVTITKDDYKTAMTFYNSKKYMEAYKYFNRVSPEDENYNDAVARLKELQPKFDSIILEERKKEFTDPYKEEINLPKLTVDEIEILKDFQQKWADSLVQIENTPINGNHLVSNKVLSPDSILLEYSKGVTKEGFDINIEQDKELYMKFYKEAISKKLSKKYADYPVYISPVANKEVLSKMDHNIKYTHPVLAFRGIDIYRGNSVYKEKIGYIECVFDDPDKDRFDMYNEIVMVRSKNGIIKIPYAKLRKNYWTTVKENDVTKTVQKCINF